METCKHCSNPQEGESKCEDKLSLLCVVGKVLERIVLKYIFNFFGEYFISIHQSGFLPGMSIVTQLIEIYHPFCKAIDEGHEIQVVFLYFSNAFDKFEHKA